MPIVRNPQGHEIISVDNNSLVARQDITDSSTETFLKCNNLGELLSSAADKINVNTGGSLQETTADILKPNTMVFGTDSVGASAQYNPIRVDGNGIQYVSNVTTTNIAPANTVNADHASVNSSVATTLKARQTIADESTGTFLRCDAAGSLLVSNASFGHLNSISSNQTNGNQLVKISSQTKTINQYASQSLAGSGAWATTIDASSYGKCSISVNSDASTNLYVYGSATSGGTYLPFKEIMINSADTGASTHNVGFVEIQSPPSFMKIYNVDSGGVVLEIIVTLSN
tara:strand:+ start:297 stop:1154 length:858 start_codon:yes stop_codon:yes gene_type:complete